MSLLSAIKLELTGLFDLLLPPACPLCRQELAVPSPTGLCRTCLGELPPLPAPRCPRCALPFATEGGVDHLCEPCLRQAPAFSQVIALGIYDGLLRESIHRLKFQNQINLDRPLARLLAENLDQARLPVGSDLIVPVPLHAQRLRQRGYNQSLLLAKQLGKHRRSPVAPRLLIRTLPTPPQQGLSLNVRQQNLRGAFALTNPLQGESVLLIDDVMTTGATVRECARVLRAGGAGEVVVAVIGRALKHH
jgi:ComF family protein